MSNETLMPADPRPRTTVRAGGTSFVGLVGVELRRLWWRRLTKVAIVAIIAFVGIASYSAYQETRPETIAQRLDDFKQNVAEMKKQQDAMSAQEKASQLAECRAQEQQASGDSPVDFGCEQMFAPPTLQDYGLVDTGRDELVRAVAQASVYVLGFLAFLLGASFVAAEFSSGAMGNWLTFAPRRLQVAASKLSAATLAGAALAGLGVGLLLLTITGVTTINRPDASLNLPDAIPSSTEPLYLSLVRIVTVVALGGLGGAAIGLLLRSTAAVVGGILAYAVIVEGFVASGIGDGRYRPWTVSLNIDAFVQNGATYYVTKCDANGCQGVSATNSFTHGWVYLLVIAVVGVVAALAVFRRRDVT
ncbi:MAG: hypothetical protein L0H96_00315 [Humibacillus sp.]|nr:hypothetical protein [Humibacillus sp.]MDN5775340.1 hypothetical protein [Humibacillus sp.]